MKKTTLYGEEIRLKDKAWSLRHGWGEVVRISDSGTTIQVRFKDFRSYYAEDGREYTADVCPTLFWDEVHITPPPKPKRMVKKWQWAFQWQGISASLSEPLSEPSPAWEQCQKLNWTEETVEE